jgi:hypothetical protein
VDELVTCGKAYANFLNGRDAQGNPNRYLSNIKSLSGAARQHLILLLAGQHLPPDLFEELCHQVESLFFCYVITRQESKSLERNFAAWAKELRSAADQGALRRFFATRFQPEFARLSQDFDSAFSLLTTSRIQFYRLRYIMAKLSQFIEEKAWSNVHDLDHYLASSIDIEHILPQTPRDDVRHAFDKESEYDAWVPRLGNLTLLEKTINTAVSNGSFLEKAPGYAKSKILLTSSLIEDPGFGVNTQLKKATSKLVQFEEWDSEAIEQRQKMLTELARQVWLESALRTEAV